MPRTKHGLPGIYNLTPLSLGDGEGSALAVDSAGNLKTTITTGDIEIGAVEIKNGTDDTRAIVNADGSISVGGGVASGATDAGNPVKVGGRYNSTPPTYTNGQRTELQTDTRGSVNVSLVTRDGTAGATIETPADNNTNSKQSLYTNTYNSIYNGATWDRARGNQDVSSTLITASGATTSQTGSDQTNYNGRGVKVVLDMTVVGTGSVTITIQGKDVVSGKYYTLLAGAAVVTNSTNVYEVYPGVTATANASASTTLSRLWRVITTANNANAATYTVGASVIV